jgi:outer membrane protein TolC
MTPSRRLQLIVAVVMLTFCLALAPQAHAQTGPKKELGGDAKVQKLLKERLALLKQIVDETEKAFRMGNGVSVEDFLRAQQAYHKAELELCETDKERIAILEKLVTLAMENERVVSAQVASGSVPHSAVLTASVNRLDAEIALERARAKAGGQAK